MMLRIIVLALTLAFTALAQNRVNFPWWNSPVVANLGLSPDQSHRIRQIVRGYRPRLLDARNNVQKAEGDLEDLINDQQMSPQAAQPLIERLSYARAESTRVFLEMSVRLRAVLTFEQWRALVRHWDDVQRKNPSDLQAPP